MMSLKSPVLCAPDDFYFITSFLYLLSLDKSDSLKDKSDELCSESGFSSTYSFRYFSLHFYKSVVSGSVLGSEVFSPTGVKSKVG